MVKNGQKFNFKVIKNKKEAKEIIYTARSSIDFYYKFKGKNALAYERKRMKDKNKRDMIAIAEE